MTSSQPARHILTIFAASDLKRSVDFYRTAFGWPVHVEVPVYVEFELHGGIGLGVYQRESFGLNTGQMPEAVPEGAITGTELYLRVDDLDEAIARPEEAGARCLAQRQMKDWGTRLPTTPIRMAT